MNLLNWILPAVGIGYLLLSAKKKQVERRLQSVSVDFLRFDKKLPPKIFLRIFNPNNIPVTTQFINLQVFFKDTKLASIQDNTKRTITYGNNDIGFDIKLSAEIIGLLFKPKEYRKNTPASPRFLKITWQVGTSVGDVSGEKQIDF
jgi:hypothetical protein